MEQIQVTKKKMKKGVKVLLILLGVFLFLLLLPVLYLNLSGFSYDDPKAMADSAPMDFTQRYTFHQADRTVDIAVDKGDLYWLMEQDGLLEPGGEIAKTLAEYGLALEKTGLELTKEGVEIAAQLRYKGAVPLPVKATLGLALEGRELVATVERVHLGGLITLNRDQLPFPKERLTFSMDPGEIHSRLSDLKSVSLSGGMLVLTCGIGRETVGELLENYGDVTDSARYLGNFEAVSVARDWQETEGNGGAFDDLLAACETMPEHYIEFRRSALAISEDFKANQYFDSSDARLLPRFFPELTRDGVTALSGEYTATETSRTEQMEAACRAVSAAFRDKTVLTNGKQFLDAADNEPLSISKLSGGAGIDWLLETDFRVIYGLNGSYSMTNGMPRLSETPRVIPTAFTGMRMNAVYVPILIARMADGLPYAAYFETEAEFVLRPLTEEEFSAMLASQRIPVFDLGLNQ